MAPVMKGVKKEITDAHMKCVPMLIDIHNDLTFNGNDSEHTTNAKGAQVTE